MISSVETLENTKPVVLVADDNPKNLILIVDILKRCDYEIHAVNDGSKALELAEKLIPDVILLDIMMPVLDGYQVCKILTSNEKTTHIPIIFITAKAETQEMLDGFKSGAVDYITKPFNREELIARVNTHIELVRSRKTIVRQNEKLNLLNNTKDKFFSIIAHDLKNPLGAMRDLSAILSDNYDHLDEFEKRDFISDLSKSSKDLFDLLENLLSWSRSQRGKIQIDIQDINLHYIVENCQNVLNLHAGKKNIHFENLVPENYNVRSDVNLLTTIIRNLISNSVKFSNDGGKIVVSVKDNPDHSEISIRDNGVGIAPDVIGKLFRIDESVSTRGTHDESGTGLGLILVKEFVEKLKGTISVASEQGQWTEVIFTIPK